MFPSFWRWILGGEMEKPALVLATAKAFNTAADLELEMPKFA